MSEDAKAALLEKLRALRRQEEEAKVLVQSIDISLVEMGFDTDIIKTGKQQQHSRTGISINNQLSFRGKQKAEEQFDMLDLDNDGQLNYEDFLGIKAFTSPENVVRDADYLHWSVWKQYLQSLGVVVTEEGTVDKNNYLKFREVIENQQPLSPELEYMGLGFLPKDLQLWAKCKEKTKDCIDFRKYQKNMRVASSDPAEGILITDEELGYLMSRIGFHLSKAELLRSMLIRVYKMKTMEELLRKCAKKNLPNSKHFLGKGDQASGLVFKEDEYKVITEDIQEVSPSQLVAWIFSCPYIRQFETDTLYKYLLSFRSKIISCMRVVDDYSRYMFHFAGHMNDRLAFRDFKTIPKLAKHLLEQSSLKFGVIIGDDKARLSGISAVFKLIRLDNPSSLLKKLKIASDSGTTIIIELLTHLDAPEDKLKLCATQLRLFIAHHLEKDFRHNPQFSGLYVTPAVNENDEAPVLRVIIVYKRIVSIDMWLQHMLIPYSFSDIMPALTGEIRTNIDLSEMVKNVTANVDSEIVAMAEINATYKRNLVSALFERVAVALSAGLTKEQAAARYEEEEIDLSNTQSAVKADAKSIAIEDAQKRIGRWRLLYPTFGKVISICKTVCHSLNLMKTAVVKFRFKSVGELFQRLTISNIWFRKFFPFDVVYVPGYPKFLYQTFCDKFTDEFNGMFFRFKNYLEEKKKEEDEKKLEEMIKMQGQDEEDEEEKSRKIIMEKLKRLGIDANAEDLFEGELEDPKVYLKQFEEEHLKHDIQGMITLELMQKCCIGLHNLEIISGNSRFTTSFSGMDIFELLPVIQSIEKVKEDLNKATRSSFSIASLLSASSASSVRSNQSSPTNSVKSGRSRKK